MFKIFRGKSVQEVFQKYGKNTNGEQFLALLLGTTEFLDGGQCGVGVERPQDIAKVEGIDFAAAVEVVDGEGEGCPWDKKWFTLDFDPIPRK